MKVKVAGFQRFKALMGSGSFVVVEMDGGTLNDLLDTLSRQYGREFEEMIFDRSSGRVKRSNLILLNGQSYLNLARGIHSPLKEGDEVRLLPVLTGGAP